MTTPNAELAYKVLDHIDAHPIGWKQEVWIAKGECGTVACFAGWTCLLNGDSPGFPDPADQPLETENVHVPWQKHPEYIPERAAALLGIEYSSADDYGHRLFDPEQTRHELADAVAEIFGPRPGGAA